MTRHEQLLEMIAAPTDECIVWPYAKNRKGGYGQVTVDGRMQVTHRVALSTISDPPTEKHQACHGPCHNRLCVNPRHLSWQTNAENSADKRRDGTHLEGEALSWCHVSTVDVDRIRSLWKGPYRGPDRTGPTQPELADEFGCDRSQISRIVNHKQRTNS